MKSKLLFLTDISNFSFSPFQFFFLFYNFHLIIILKKKKKYREKKLNWGCGEEEDFVCDSAYLVQFDIKGEDCGGVEVYVEPHEWFHMDDCRVVTGHLSQSQVPLSHGGQAP